MSASEIATPHGCHATRRHIFFCCDPTNPKCCDIERGRAAWEFLSRRLNELGLTGPGGVLLTKANCLQICESGPVALVRSSPEGVWYGACDPPLLERIIQEHVIAGRVVEDALIARHDLD